MKFTDLFNAQVIFDPVPQPETKYFIPMVVIFTILLLAATAIMLLAKGNLRKLYGRLVAPFLTFGILGLIHLGARYESLPWLASIFFLILILAGLLIWMSVIAIWMFRFTPKYIQEKKTEDRFLKYLPKPKKAKAAKAQ